MVGQPYYTTPVFTSSTQGWFSVTYLDQSHPSHLAWFHTTDSGATWKLSTLIVTPPGAYDVATAVTPGNRLLAVPKRNLLSTVNGSATLIRLPRQVAGKNRGIMSLDFTTPTIGWAQVYAGACLDFKSDCVQATLLYQTRDGGKTWQLLKPAAP